MKDVAAGLAAGAVVILCVLLAAALVQVIWAVDEGRITFYQTTDTTVLECPQ